MIERLVTSKKILITGGGGFIGGNLIRRLLKKFEKKIFNIDKFGYASDLESHLNINHDNYKFIQVDLINFKKINQIISEIKPDLILNLAAESHVDRSISDPRIFIESNILGTFNLLESVRKYWENIPKENQDNFLFHHISTDEVFGSLGNEGYFSENSCYDPRSPYSASKASSDHLVKAWHHTYGLPTLITNCSNNYGPWQFPEKLIPLSILKAISKEKIPVYGNGLNIRDWLHVEDHIDALLNVINKGIIGSTYCIGGKNEKTNLEVLNIICRIINEKINDGFKYETLITHVDDRIGHDFRYAIDSSKIKNEFNWEPKFTFEKGISQTIDWYLKNLNWCNRIQNISGYKGERLGMK